METARQLARKCSAFERSARPRDLGEVLEAWEELYEDTLARECEAMVGKYQAAHPQRDLHGVLLDADPISRLHATPAYGGAPLAERKRGEKGKGGKGKGAPPPPPVLPAKLAAAGGCVSQGPRDMKAELARTNNGLAKVHIQKRDRTGNVTIETRDGEVLERAGAARYAYVVDTAPDAELHRVGDAALFIGSQDAAFNAEGLKRLGVGHVVNAAADAVASRYSSAAAAGEVGLPRAVVYCDLHLLDIPEAAPALRAEVAQACAFIDTALGGGGGCLVHCNAGVSRSSAVIIAWLMSRKGMAFGGALALVRQTRPSARPNDGFDKFLRSPEFAEICAVWQQQQ